MFTHKIIDYFSLILSGKIFPRIDQKYFAYTKYCQDFILCSNKFDLGHANNLPSNQPYRVDGPKKMVYTDFSGLRMPYSKCWLETIVDGETNENYPTGILVDEVRPNLLYIGIISCVDDAWIACPFSITVKIGHNCSVIGQEINVIPRLEYNMPHDLLAKTLHDLVITAYEIVVTFLRLMSCKNISAELIKAPEKLNKKRLRNGKLPIFDYYVLNIDPLSKSKHAYHDPSIPLSHNRVHLCRGHFKTFTKEHPLLGRGIGTYWWQPHARGQNKEGIIVKDYKLAGGNCG